MAMVGSSWEAFVRCWVVVKDVAVLVVVLSAFVAWKRSRKCLRPTSMPSSAGSRSDFLLPKKVFLVRHGESMGNVNHDMFKEMPDWKIKLTAKGKEQARQAGEDIKSKVGDAPVVIYYSPYMRTQQTVKQIVKSLNPEQIVYIEEDPRLREQDFGNFQNAAMSKYKEERVKFGRFFYRFPNGESGADVYDRVSSFLDSMFRHFRKHAEFTHANKEYNLVIVSHGLTIRIILMRWFRWSVHQFDNLFNPQNAASVILERSTHSNQLRVSADSWHHLTFNRSRQVSESEPDLTMASSLSCSTSSDSDSNSDSASHTDSDSDSVSDSYFDSDESAVDTGEPQSNFDHCFEGQCENAKADGLSRKSYRWDKNLAKFTAKTTPEKRKGRRKTWHWLQVNHDIPKESQLRVDRSAGGAINGGSIGDSK